MDAAVQEIIALALVAAVIGLAVWRHLNKPKNSGCNSCKSNPSKSSQKVSSGETPLRFMQKPGSRD